MRTLALLAAVLLFAWEPADAHWAGCLDRTDLTPEDEDPTYLIVASPCPASGNVCVLDVEESLYGYLLSGPVVIRDCVIYGDVSAGGWDLTIERSVINGSVRFGTWGTRGRNGYIGKLSRYVGHLTVTDSYIDAWGGGSPLSIGYPEGDLGQRVYPPAILSGNTFANTLLSGIDVWAQEFTGRALVVASDNSFLNVGGAPISVQGQGVTVVGR